MLTIVYQDCVMCGSREEWGEKTIEGANKIKEEVRKLSFASPEGEKLCREAIYAGVTELPFITNGVIFSQNIEDFVPKKTKTRKVKKAEVQEDGIVQSEE